MPIALHHSSEPLEKSVIETALIQLVDYIDHKACGRSAPMPAVMLLTLAGFNYISILNFGSKSRLPRPLN